MWCFGWFGWLFGGCVVFVVLCLLVLMCGWFVDCDLVDGLFVSLFRVLVSGWVLGLGFGWFGVGFLWVSWGFGR